MTKEEMILMGKQKEIVRVGVYWINVAQEKDEIGGACSMYRGCRKKRGF